MVPGCLRYAQRQRWACGLYVAVALSFLIAGCTLPSQQLSLPGPITGSVSTSPLDNNNRKGGVPASDPGDPDTFGPRIYDSDGQLIGAPVSRTLARSDSTHHAVDEKGVTLNLVGASVPEAAKAVLGDILGLNYAVSDKVKAAITLQTSQPIPPQNLLRVFEAILQSEGAVIVEKSGVYHIVPSSAGIASRPPVKWRKKTGGRMVGMASEVIPLRYVSAPEMERVLKSVAPDTSISRIDDTRNLILVSGTATELESIRDTVSVFDVDWMEGMSFALLPVESADPEAIVEELDTIFANDKNGPAKGVVRFVPNKRLRSVLVISSQPEYLRKAEGWVRRIDLAGQATEKRVFVYHVQHRPAGELAELLKRVYNSNQRQNDRDRPAATPDQATTVISSPEIGQTSGNADANPDDDAIIPSSFGALQNLPGGRTATADQAATDDNNDGQAIETGSTTKTDAPHDLSGQISIVADDPNNSLVITATHNEYVRMRHILSRIDVAPNQVLLEATIAEVSLNDQLRYGLRWFFQSGDHGFRLSDNALGAVAPVFPGFSYFLNMPNIQVALDALSDVTDVNVVSSPSLMVLDNKRAVLQVGAEVPVATQSAVSVAAPGAPIVNSISFRNTGVILGITPRVSDNGRVLLDIEQEVSDVVPTTSSNLDSPTFQQRRIKTTVTVGDGESIVLAGFMQDRATVNNSGVPILNQIPVLGNAFKSKDNDVERTELLIAITPQVVRDHNQIRSISNEFRDRMNFNTRPQRSGPPERREDIDRLIVR